MLPTNTTLPSHSDRTYLPNIKLLDESQSQVYSLLASAKHPSSSKRAHRKKKSKLEEISPVTINPQIARTPRGVIFTAQVPDSVQTTIPTHPVHMNNLSYRLCIDQQSYDTNNNIYHHQIPTPSISGTPFVPLRASPAFPLATESMSRIGEDMAAHHPGKFPFLELNRSLGRHAPGRTRSEVPTRRSDGTIPYLADDNDTSSFDQTQYLPPAPASVDVSGKGKPSKSVTGPSISSRKTETLKASHQFIGLPAVIPNSISDVYQFSRDVSSSANFAPLTPPASIVSAQSPPSNGNYEASTIPLPQYLLQPTTEGSLPFRPEYSFSPKPGNRLLYDFPRLLAANRQQYYMLPTNSMGASLIPMGYPSVLPNSVPSMSVPSEKSERRTPLLPHAIAEVCTSEQSINSGSRREKAPSKRRSTTVDIRAKKQLKHLSRRNKMAVLKFMMRKRKQQQQRPLCEIQTAEKPGDEVVSPVPTGDTEVETGLTDIITPSLKVSFDATQKIEFISLYYHRRRLPEVNSQPLSSVAKTKDNKLDLLLEAVEYIEAWQGKSKLPVDSNQ